MIFRELDKANIDEIFSCISLSNETQGLFPSNRITPKEIEAFRKPEVNTIICEKNNEILGYGTLCGTYISDLYVYPTMQRKGIGTKILSKLEEIAKESGKNQIKLIAVRGSETFYQKQGYEIFKDSSGDSIAAKFLE